MGLAAELKDFMTGFQSGKSMLSLTESEYNMQKDQKEQKELKGALDLGESGAKSGGVAPYTFDSSEPEAAGRSPGAGGSPSFGGLGTSATGNGISTPRQDKAISTPRGDAGVIENKFISTLKAGGLTNPIGLAAVAAYGNRESRYSPANVNRSWSDPSERGAPGTSGGIMSWRADRLANMRRATAGAPDPVVAQAQFMLRENPALTRALQNARTPEEANRLMANAWQFAGYNRPGGENAARLATTRQYASRFGADYARGGLVLDEEELLRQGNAVSVPMDRELPAPAIEIDLGAEPAPAEERRRVAPSLTEEVSTPDATRRVAPSITDPVPPEDRRRVAPSITDPVPPEDRRRVAPSISDAVPAEEARTIGPPEAVKASRGALELTPVEPEAQAADKIDGPTIIRDTLKGLSQKLTSSAAIPEADPTRITKVSALARGEDAATPQEVRAIDQTIDPDGRMDRDTRALARIEAGYRFYLQRGEPEKAKKWAESLVLYSRTAVQTAGAIARRQLQAGDYKGAATMIQRAHNEIPDGSTLHIDKVGDDGRVSYQLVDKYGDYTKRGEATVNQMMNLATGMENGSEWLKQMQISAMPIKDRIELRRSDEDRAAVQGYNRVASDDFLHSMTPEQFRAYNAMSPSDQNAYRTNEEQRRRFDLQGQRFDADVQQRREQAERQEEAAARAERSIALREKTAEERMEYFRKRDELRDEKARDTQEYSGLKDTYLDAKRNLDNVRRDTPYDREAIAAAQAELDTAEGAITDWAKQGENRQDYIKPLLRARTTGSGAGAGGGAGRDTSGARTGTEGRVRELTKQFGEMEYNFNKAPPADTAERKKAETALALKKAEIEFTRNQRPFREYEEEVGTAVATAFGVGTDLENLSEEQKALRPRIEAAVGGVLAANRDVSAGTAADLVALARAGNGIRFTEDGRVQVGNARPVYMSPPAVIALGQMAKEAKLAKQQKEAASRPAARTTPRRPATAEERAAGDEALGRATDRGVSRSSARNTAERERLRQQLGPEYMEDLPLSELRRRARMLQGPADANVGGIPF